MKFQYNLNYIGGIEGYNKRNIYTLKIKENEFFVNGFIKSKKFSYHQINNIYFGSIESLRGKLEIVEMLLFGHVDLLDYRLNKKLKYCLVIELKDSMILFAEEFEDNLKNAYQRLNSAYQQYR